MRCYSQHFRRAPYFAGLRVVGWRLSPAASCGFSAGSSAAALVSRVAPSGQVRMQQMTSHPIIHVYLITYRRPLLLRRALASILAQSYENFLVKIINDDPDDTDVLEMVAQVNDQRVSLFNPVRNRGATANFNIAFGDRTAPLVSVLEDDNWWEPGFLEVMHQTLLRISRSTRSYLQRTYLERDERWIMAQYGSDNMES